VTEDDGHAISYKVLKRGTVVRSADGLKLGTVRSVEEAKRELMFDGIVIDTDRGKRFIDAPEIARITESGVTCTFDAKDAESYIQNAPAPTGLAGRFKRLWRR
jgi:hypothetical protein